MKPPNLLASKWGRLTAFFFLYISEGIPYGFTSVAITAQMRRQGLDPEAVGQFVAMLYLPWGFKWIAAPFVDLFYSNRFGRRRLWIVVCQLGMAVTILSGLPVDFVENIRWFTYLIFFHNIFGAVQDVAIDALACEVLPKEERGLGNGLMFCGSYVGAAIGGSGVLYLVPYTGFNATFIFVASWIVAITVLIVAPLKECHQEKKTVEGSRLMAAISDVTQYSIAAFRAFFGSKAATAGLFFAILPTGAFALSITLQSNLAVEFGFNDIEVANLNLASTVIAASCCVIGGWLSDRFGRRRSMAVFIVCTIIPSAYMAWQLYEHGWIMPIKQSEENPIRGPASLIMVFWVTTMTFNIFHGLLYGTRTALFMDVCSPKVAATQFTAYMALLNLANAIAAKWQGVVIVRWGYPTMMVADILIGLACLAFLPFMKARH